MMSFGAQMAANGATLHLAAEDPQSDYVVLKAVRQTSIALLYAAELLQGGRDVFLEAGRQQKAQGRPQGNARGGAAE